MADPDPSTPQVVDPERVVDLTRLLQIRGPLGVLNVLDTIVPVVSMGDVVTRTINILQPAFRSTDLFSVGFLTGSPVQTVHADTGPLLAGTYDVLLAGPMVEQNAAVAFTLAHRNAADTADLMLWGRLVSGGLSGTDNPYIPFGYEIADDERLRVVNNDVIAAGTRSIATILAHRR